jgi:hypothetical protein
VHDPAKVVCDLAVTLALGGDCLADVALLRAEPGVYGRVASDPTVSRTVDALARDAPKVLAAIDAARAKARARVWRLAGTDAPDHDHDAERPLVVDVDATLVTAHSEKELARATFKRGYGFHPLCAFVDHGPDGTGEPLPVMLRAGNAGSVHRGRSHRGHQAGVAAAARASPRHPPRTAGAGAHRCRRLHPPSARLACRATVVVLGRVHPPRRHGREAGAHPGPARVG